MTNIHGCDICGAAPHAWSIDLMAYLCATHVDMFDAWVDDNRGLLFSSWMEVAR